MKENRYFDALDDYEMGMILRGLVELKNQMLEEGKYTDCVDELIIKVGTAPMKKFRVLQPAEAR